jgi:hypothetical protein
MTPETVRVMSTICSPVKLTPPPTKKGRPSIDWQRCIICQVFTAERLYIPTAKGRSTFISAVNSKALDRVTIVTLSSFDDGL